MNTAVRTLPGHDGRIVIVAAWCHTCAQEAMPDDHGRCVWCETPIVGREFVKAWT